jgi:pilus assembly protein Flp/PilA
MFTQIRFIAQYLSARFVKNERGATAVEYGLLVALIAVAMIVVFTAFKGQLTNLFNENGRDIAGTNAPNSPVG